MDNKSTLVNEEQWDLVAKAYAKKKAAERAFASALDAVADDITPLSDYDLPVLIQNMKNSSAEFEVAIERYMHK